MPVTYTRRRSTQILPVPAEVPGLVAVGEIHFGEVGEERAHVRFGCLRSHHIEVGVFLRELAAAVVSGDMGDQVLASVAAAVQEQDHGPGPFGFGGVETVEHIAVFFLFEDIQPFADLLGHLFAGIEILSDPQRPVGAVIELLGCDLQRTAPRFHASDGDLEGLFAARRESQRDLGGIHAVMIDPKAFARPAAVGNIGIGYTVCHRSFLPYLLYGIGSIVSFRIRLSTKGGKRREPGYRKHPASGLFAVRDNAFLRKWERQRRCRWRR